MAATAVGIAPAEEAALTSTMDGNAFSILKVISWFVESRKFMSKFTIVPAEAFVRYAELRFH